MKRFRYIIVLAWVTGIVSACTDLDTKMNNQWSVDDTWTNAEKAQGVLLSVYQDVLTVPDAWDGNFLDAATDNAMTRVYDSSVYRAGQGGFSRTNNPLGNWSACYDQLQRIHTFLDNGLTDEIRYSISSDEIDQAYKKRLRGEAIFLRAWCSFNLLRMYGGKTDNGQVLGYPIVTH